MFDKIKRCEKNVLNFVFNEEGNTLEKFRLDFLSKKGEVLLLFEYFKTLPVGDKKKYGEMLNDLKNRTLEKYNNKNNSKTPQKQIEKNTLFPTYQNTPGAIHPIRIVEEKVSSVFLSLGFDFAEAIEIEDDYHNFAALNFKEDHPARDMQDTFFIGTNILRTHTSSVQIREMKKGVLPLRIIMPGRVYRNEDISARSNCFFHQLEGLYIDKNVTFSDLKQTLFYFVQQFFGEGIKVRFRASYFPFTEPSAEMDIWAGTDTEENKRLTKGTGWLEVLGCGMVHPNVLEACNIDSKIYNGFAFGMGLDRMTMLKYKICDIRELFINDIRLLSQFTGV